MRRRCIASRSGAIRGPKRSSSRYIATSNSRGFSLRAARLLLGAGLGAGAWLLARPALLALPTAPRFAAAWLLFTLGPGLAAGFSLTRQLDPLRRAIVVLGLGSAAAPVLVEALGRLDRLSVFPYVACALGGAALAHAWPARRPAPKIERTDVVSCTILLALALGLGSIVFAHRLIETPRGTTIHGDYDSFDLSFYASWAAEAAHTIPPTAGYYAGQELHAAYYTQLVLAMVHRFADVPLLPILFGYSWPIFLSLGALTAYVLVRGLAPPGAALLAVVLIVVGGDLSYLAAWWLPLAGADWDYVLWPTNFLSPTMEVLHFNTWAPTLPVFFTGLYAAIQGARTGHRGWILVSAFMLAVLFQFKPFAYVVVLGALAGAIVFSGADRAARRRFTMTLVGSVLLALPFIYSAATLENPRSKLLIDFFLLPQRMLIKLGLTDSFARLADRLTPVTVLERPLMLAAATALFLAVGFGIRWLGVLGVWRAIRNRVPHEAAGWRLLGWGVVAGVVVPFVLATEPYVDTLQFYQTGLYLLWVFTGVALASFAPAKPGLRIAAMTIAIVIALPSSAHYLTRKWTDAQRPPLATLDPAEQAISTYLQTTDPRTTVVLHDRPQLPSLVNVVSGRRVVLAWGHPNYAARSEARARDVNEFFASASGDAEAALQTLKRYRVTHVIVSDGRGRVHADVLGRLEPVLRLPGAALYRVPPPIREDHTPRTLQ